MSRKNGIPRNNSTIDRLPPHSPEAEAGVLGCVMLDPSVIDRCFERIKSGDAFYDLRHQEIYRAMSELHRKRKVVDLISLQERLKANQMLDEVGGIAYLASLQDAVPSVANLEYYIDILRDKYELRKIISLCSETVNQAFEFNGDLIDLKSLVRSALDKAFEPDAAADQSASWNELLGFDTDQDENCVIGMKDGKTTRYLCRGHGAWVIGPSGVGKSSFLLRLGVAFAAGLGVWGIMPVRPLRVLVIQAENDIGDMAEMAKGIEAGLGVDEFNNEIAAAMISTNLKVLTVTGKIGQQFCIWLRSKIVEFGADLVLADPLLSFAGIDVSRQDQASQFCRVWLDPVLRETGAVLISNHHTGKPPKADKRQGEPSLYDLAYSGIGSSELVNWARAIILLQPIGDRKFKLILSKRGSRAWATHPNGDFTQIVWLKHSDRGIHWEQIEPPIEDEPKEREGSAKGGRPSEAHRIASSNLASFCLACPTDGEGLREISTRLEKWLASNGEDISKSTCTRCIPLLVANGKLAKGQDLKYRKGKNA